MSKPENLIRRQIAAIQMLRAIAALAVLLCHALYFAFPAVRVTGSHGWTLDIFLASFGVNLFFVISGFLMASIARASPAGRFITHRVARIYPIYWIAVTVVTLAHFFAHSPVSTNLAALALSPGPDRPFVLYIQWTLQFEIIFYLVVAIAVALGLGQRMAVIAIIWIIAGLIARGLWPDWHTDQPPLHLILLNTRCAPFAFGLLIPTFIARWQIGTSLKIAGLLAVIFADALPHDFCWPMGLGCAILVAWAVSHDRRDRPSAQNLLTRLGDWSYALYLIHAPIVIAVTSLAIWKPFSFALALAIPLALCVPFGKLDVELHNRLRAFMDRRPHLGLALSMIVLAIYVLA